jgi:hypothetical protein
MSKLATVLCTPKPIPTHPEASQMGQIAAMLDCDDIVLFYHEIPEQMIEVEEALLGPASLLPTRPRTSVETTYEPYMIQPRKEPRVTTVAPAAAFVCHAARMGDCTKTAGDLPAGEDQKVGRSLSSSVADEAPGLPLHSDAAAALEAAPFHSSRVGALVLQSSRNMLEASTGCHAWPAGLWMAQFVLSHSELFRGLHCLELGCGVGVLGVCLVRCGARRVCTARLTRSKPFPCLLCTYHDLFYEYDLSQSQKGMRANALCQQGPGRACLESSKTVATAGARYRCA